MFISTTLIAHSQHPHQLLFYLSISGRAFQISFPSTLLPTSHLTITITHVACTLQVACTLHCCIIAHLHALFAPIAHAHFSQWDATVSLYSYRSYRMSGGDLFDRITTKGSFTESEARIAMRHILSAVDFLHDRSLVHRDLKVLVHFPLSFSCSSHFFVLYYFLIGSFYSLRICCTVQKTRNVWRCLILGYLSFPRRGREMG